MYTLSMNEIGARLHEKFANYKVDKSLLRPD